MHCTILLFIIYCLETATVIDVRLNDVVDLTWPFDSSTVYWTNSQPFIFTKRIAEINENGIWYASNDFCSGEHGGTHFDAPYHFNKKGWKVGQIPVKRLIAKGIKIDLTKEVRQLHHRTRLLPKHLLEWQNKHGTIPENSVILVHFGWSKYYSNRTEYLGIDENNKFNFPGVSLAAAEWIAQSGNVVGVGVDTASVDPGSDNQFSSHRILSAQQIYVLENVKIPEIFPEEGFMLYVMPMKIKEGSGAPLRIVAIPFNALFNPSNLAAPNVPWFGYVIVVVSSVLLYVLHHPTD